jgi:hypothetical protein
MSRHRVVADGKSCLRVTSRDTRDLGRHGFLLRSARIRNNLAIGCDKIQPTRRLMT